MQVRRRLKINTAVLVITAVIILIILSLALYHLNNVNESGKIIEEIIAGSLESVTLKDNYLQSNATRSKVQWLAEYEEVGKLLKSASDKFRGAQDIKTLVGMQEDHESTGKIFLAIAENREKRLSSDYSAARSQEIEDRLVSQLDMRVYDFVTNGRRLRESNQKIRASALRLAGAGIVFVFLILVAVTLINSRMMGRTITDRIQRLRDGALVIGAGNLDHKIGIKGDDEFAELSEVFDAMTAKLGVSYDKLESEIDERKQSEEQLKLFIEHAPASLAMFDSQMRYLRVSRRWLSDYNLEGRELRGLSHYDIFPEIPERWKAIHRRALAGEVVLGDNDRFDRTDGSVQWLQWEVRPWYDASGNVAGIVVFSEDITERKRAENTIVELNRNLAARNSELVAANQELEAFSYSVSHDLRAPLRHISAYLEMLNKNLGSRASDKAKHYMNVVAGASKKMSMLIDDLLAFSRMGRTDIQKTTVNFAGIIQEIIGEMAPDIKGRNIEWKIGELPSVHGDTDMLRLALINLIANATKYTAPCSKAKIEIGSTEEAKEFIFFVRDNGVGFDMKYVDKLFGVFQRLHQDNEFEGTGIGLANVRRIISRHGGRTWAEGAVGQGAVFYFTIPKIREI